MPEKGEMMIIVMQRNATAHMAQQVVDFIRTRGLTEHISRGAERTIIGAVGDERVFSPEEILRLPGVEKAMRVVNDWRIISRETQSEDSIMVVRGIALGGEHFQTVPLYRMLEPAFRQPESQMACLDPFYAPSSAYAPPPAAIELEAAIGRYHDEGKAVWVRIRDVRQIEAALDVQADVLYLGGEMLTQRSVQHEVGRLNVPVVLTKDKHHKIAAWLMAAERIVLQGNHFVLLGDAGTLTLAEDHPYRLDVESIARARALSHLPVVANVTRLAYPWLPETLLCSLARQAGAQAVLVSGDK